jgi:hypothetical protein
LVCNWARAFQPVHLGSDLSLPEEGPREEREGSEVEWGWPTDFSFTLKTAVEATDGTDFTDGKDEGMIFILHSGQGSLFN